MTLLTSWAAAAAVALPFLVGTAVGGEQQPRAVEVFRFQDPAIVESSGLVVTEGVFVTTNDSGDSGRVFSVDPATGETVGVTSWPEEPEDVEALAPAGPGVVWVGDVGDNGASRGSVTVLRVPVGPGDREVDPPTYELVYPDGPRDAETLLAHPTTGRLYVVSKGALGGTLYAAPAELAEDEPNRLREVGPVLPVATDGAFLPDGRHLVLRDYGRAVVYAFPSLAVVGEVTLPEQRQGEGIAVDADGAAYVSSEGLEAPVLEVALPPLPAPPSGSPAAPAAPGDGPTPPPASRQGEELPQAPVAARPAWPWFLGGWLGLAVIVFLLWALRRRD